MIDTQPFRPGRRRFLLGSGGALLLTACGRKIDVAQARTLVIGKSADIGTLDPAVAMVPSDFTPMGLAYERLVRMVIRDGLPTGDLVGELASAWGLEEDGRNWWFEIASGHRFDDGSAVDAHAVAFSFQRTLEIGLGIAQAMFGVEGVEATSRFRVRFRMAMPVPILPMILALAPAAIINPAVMRHERKGDKARAWLSENTAGSGPYRPSSWLRGQRMSFERNPHSPRTPAHFERVVLKVVRDAATYRTQLAKSDLDMFEAVTPDSAKLLEARGDARIVPWPAASVIALVPNNQRKPMDDRRVRQALACAIDVPQIIRTVLQGMASPVSGVLPAGVPGHDAALLPPVRDPGKARALLAEAGHGGGLALKLSYIQYSAASDAIALALRSQLAETGIAIELEVLAPSAIARVTSGDFDLTFSSWFADFPDPWPIMNFAYHSRNIGEGMNLARYADADVDRLIAEAETTMDPAARVALYQQAQARVHADMAMVNMFEQRGLLACRNDVEGLDHSFWYPGVYDVAAMSRAGVPA